MHGLLHRETPMTARRLPRPRQESGPAASPVPTAGEVMRPPVLVVDGGEAALAVWTLMQHRGADLALITDNGRYVGLVDLHDLWVSWAFDLTGSGSSVLRLVSLVPVVARRAPLDEVCRSLLASRHGAVLVVDDTGVVEGIVTSVDVVRLMAEGGVTC
ncbi:MAG: CBS domain-containing protein [Mycobacteriales bacterium]